jgi:hypothetical protein
VDGLLLVGHVAHLIGDGFEPGLVGLDEGNHLGEPIRKRVELLDALPFSVDLLNRERDWALTSDE